MPYIEVRAPRRDFTRVVAEFRADGPDSETPPGHWFQIYNSLASDHPDFIRPVGDDGEVVGSLEYDIHTYFTLDAVMLDSAIAAWSIKGAYDYIRPVSALRYMASPGQSTDLLATSHHIHGIPVLDGFIETISRVIRWLVMPALMLAESRRVSGEGPVLLVIHKLLLQEWAGCC
jgi:hypothetical protein